MKATGIVRRIDDLGRIVIPKEIRKTLKVKEGMPLEIYTDKEGGIILRKFLPFSEMSSLSEEFAQCVAQQMGNAVFVTDRESCCCCRIHRRGYCRRTNQSYIREYFG